VGSLKLIESYEDGSVELFDLEADPGETTNLADQLPQQVDSLRNLLLAWRLDLDAQMPAPNPNYQSGSE
jgi:hypothetical protein